jgi:hypothetical protein
MADALAAMGAETRSQWRKRSVLGGYRGGTDLERFESAFSSGDQILSAVAMLLGHHSNGRLGFETSGTGPVNYVTAARISSKFDSLSVAVVNGCSTSGGAGTDFVSKLAGQGMGAIIATSSSVYGAMAGGYFRCFEQSLAKDGKGRKLSQVHYDAVACLYADGMMREKGREKTRTWVDDEWSVNAFRYVLFGNGNIRVCRPR